MLSRWNSLISPSGQTYTFWSIWNWTPIGSFLSTQIEQEKNIKSNEISSGKPHTCTLAGTELLYVDAGGVNKTYFSVEFMLMIITTDEYDSRFCWKNRIFFWMCSKLHQSSLQSQSKHQLQSGKLSDIFYIDICCFIIDDINYNFFDFATFSVWTKIVSGVPRRTLG